MGLHVGTSNFEQSEQQVWAAQDDTVTVRHPAPAATAVVTVTLKSLSPDRHT